MKLCRWEVFRAGRKGFSLVEVMVAVFLLSVLVLSLFGAFSTGLSAVQSSRENLRATQILMQKMEAVRLFTWSQGTNAVYAAPLFTDWYDPEGTNTHSAGARYQGFVSVAPAPASVPAAYRNNMRLVTVTLYWTNYIGTRRGVPQTRQMETLVARYGMQNYVY